MDYIIFDLEWNRLSKTVKKRCPDEIIQIGAVKYNQAMKCIGTFNCFIKPVLYKKIDHIVKKITGIDMEVLKTDGVLFSQAIKKFKKFVGNDCVLMSWGAQDAQILRNNCIYFNPDAKLDFLKQYVDMQRYVTHALTKSPSGGNQLGVKQAADLTKVFYKEESLHDAFVDASVSGKVFAKLFDKEKLNKYIVDASVKNCSFKDIPITDLKNKAIDKRVFKIRCPECGRFMRKKHGWHLNGNKFFSLHLCRKCKRQYMCSVEILKTYGNLIKYKTRIKQAK